MNRCSFCAWIPIWPWPVWPLAGHARLGQHTVVGSMTVLLVVLGSMPRGVCLDPRFLYKYTSPRLNAELPGKGIHLKISLIDFKGLRALQAIQKRLPIGRKRSLQGFTDS